MSKLNKETIRNLSKLSRIGCSEEEQDSLLKDLARILDYIDLLNEIDTEQVRPCNQVLKSNGNVVRDDVVGVTMPRDVFLANAPERIGGLVRVPPVMKGDKS